MDISHPHEISSRIDQLLIYVHDLIIRFFNKEGIAIFVILCLMFFIVAGFAFGWAFKSGQFSNIEDAKFEMLEPDDAKECFS